MSRIGRMPITVPAGVTVNVAEGNVGTQGRADEGSAP
jgi:large subunit ribosomal protein L6